MVFLVIIYLIHFYLFAKSNQMLVETRNAFRASKQMWKFNQQKTHNLRKKSNLQKCVIILKIKNKNLFNKIEQC